MRLRKYILLGVLILPLLSATVFIIWASLPSQPMSEALAATVADSQVIVEDQNWLVFRPALSEPVSGLIFYPGGRVDARAYAPLAREIAQSGYQVVIVPMPLNLAIFGSARGQDVIESYPDVQLWVIGGHSLGGAMAARFAHQNPDSVEGLVLLASYPASSDDLSDHDLSVLSIYGTNDTVMAEGSIESSLALLPERTEWIPIEGGNHAQFGWYGSQAGDGQATITRHEQANVIVQSILNFMRGLEQGEKSVETIWSGWTNQPMALNRGE
jgi:hypothetical protein